MSKIELSEGATGLLHLPADKVGTLAKLFQDAESWIKSIEHDGEGLDIPSINELRYVGYHLLRALSSGDRGELEKAENHAKRALYDACEAIIVLNLEEIKKFEEDYRTITVSDVIKNYSDLMTKADEARALIQETGADTREEYYQKCEVFVKDLKSINAILRSARRDLNVKISDRRTVTVRWIVGSLLTVALAIGGWSVTIATKSQSQLQTVSNPVEKK
ncbi:MAG: hypothetical protein PHU46_05195 [Rhodocyclaceae bacterium]|nr:hypothetical protein [Rhodocyclaceae bacterium]